MAPSTVADRVFLAAGLQRITITPEDIDWHGVARDTGYVNVTSARARFTKARGRFVSEHRRMFRNSSYNLTPAKRKFTRMSEGGAGSEKAPIEIGSDDDDEESDKRGGADESETEEEAAVTSREKPRKQGVKVEKQEPEQDQERINNVTGRDDTTSGHSPESEEDLYREPRASVPKKEGDDRFIDLTADSEPEKARCCSVEGTLGADHEGDSPKNEESQELNVALHAPNTAKDDGSEDLLVDQKKRFDRGDSLESWEEFA